jgi:acetyl esterase/lipase
MSPSQELLAHAYQPPDGDILHRYRFVPSTGGPTFPTVLMLPPDVFNIPYGANGSPSERVATRDLQAANFLVFQIEHRLAPGHGFLPGQDVAHGSLGHAPDQTDDVKRQILAALADSQCNGSIYLVGGSGGGCLALFCALDPTTGGATGSVQGWDNGVRLHIKAVVSLSGPTYMDDWNNPGGLDMTTLMSFENSCDNYVGLPDQTHGAPLVAASPWNLALNYPPTSCPPVRLYGTIKDPVPYEQANVMWTALTTTFGNPPGKFIEYVLSDTTGLHAFNYWHTINDHTGMCVSHEVTAFLQANP